MKNIHTKIFIFAVISCCFLNISASDDTNSSQLPGHRAINGNILRRQHNRTADTAAIPTPESVSTDTTATSITPATESTIHTGQPTIFRARKSDGTYEWAAQATGQWYKDSHTATVGASNYTDVTQMNGYVYRDASKNPDPNLEIPDGYKIIGQYKPSIGNISRTAVYNLYGKPAA